MSNLIKCVIIDDEIQARKLLRKYITDTCLFEIIKEFGNSTSAIDELDSIMPEVIFLDIQMPGKSGFEILYELKASTNFCIVFTTAYDQYAVEAFNVSAVDYLLKPFDKQRFNQSVMKICKAVESKRLDFIQKKEENIGFAFSNKRHQINEKIDRLTCKYGNKLKIIQLFDVVYFEAAGNYTKAHTLENFYLLNISISELQPKLSEDTFIRTHRSYIINKSFIESIEPHFNGEYILTLKSNITIKVSRSYKDAFNTTMGIF